MSKRTGTAHVVTTTRKYKNRVYRTHLLRRSYREDGKVKNETLGNLSHLPESLINIIRRSLQGETFVPAASAFEVLGSRSHAAPGLCMLAYYVEWYLREAWRELLFADTDQAAKATRDPVAPARRRC